MEKLRIGTDFSGVGAFEHAVKRLNLEHQSIFACDIDKYARISYLANHDHPEQFPTDVYEREIPTKPLDFYVSTFPCQSFSLAGKRLGKNDKRGILFYNTHEFIQKNKPRYFICENVKGLLSDDNGNTMNEIISLLGGKSVNGDHVWFPHEDSVPYHVYFKVMNAKKHGVPQNRERVFLVGIRDDMDNSFQFPKEEHLTTRLKDVLEKDVDEKYFLSDKMVKALIKSKHEHTSRVHDINGGYPTITAKQGGGHEPKIKIIGNTNPSGNGMNGNVFDEDGISPTLSTNKGEGIKIKSATSRGYETATENDSINFSVPNSETRRGRVGKSVPQTLDTQCNQGICIPVLTPDRLEKRQNGRRFKNDGDEAFTVTTQDRHGIYNGYRIRRLTPKECFRLMDFPDSHYENCKKEGVSDSQLYKQAGNSVVVKMFELLIKQLLKI